MSWDDCEPAALPDVVIGRILAAANPKPDGGEAEHRVNERARDTRGAGGDAPPQAGRQRSVTAASDYSRSACRAVEHDLSDAAAVATIRQYAAKHPFPRDYSDGEIVARLRDAEKKTERGSAVVIANYQAVEVEDDDGEKKTVNVPRSMTDIIDTINKRMGDWPRRVDNMLFVDDPKHGLDYFDRRTTAGLFGWLRRHCKVTWAKGGSLGCASRVVRGSRTDGATVRSNRAAAARTADGRHLLSRASSEAGRRFAPTQATRPIPARDNHRPRPDSSRDDDGVMGWAAWLSARVRRHVATMAAASENRKCRKSIGYLCGGHIDVSAGEDIERLKTRMLTPGARTKRIALLDNVKTLRLSWAELEAMITSPIISGRQLYVGEGQRPNLLHVVHHLERREHGHRYGAAIRHHQSCARQE